jgi:DNA-directed RNA polymerase sigma subunit (sigma70/sigma32)
MWVQIGIQAFITTVSIGTAWVALMVRLTRLETQVTHIINTLDGQQQEVRRIEQRLGKLENKVSALEAIINR